MEKMTYKEALLYIKSLLDHLEVLKKEVDTTEGVEFNSEYPAQFILVNLMNYVDIKFKEERNETSTDKVNKESN